MTDERECNMTNARLLWARELNKEGVYIRREKWLRSDGTIVEYFFDDGKLIGTTEVKK